MRRQLSGDGSVGPLRNGEHGGNVHRFIREKVADHQQLIDFSANINPIGPPAWLRSHINRYLEEVIHYPDPDCHEMVHAIAERYHVAPSSVIPANGTTELLHLLPRILERRPVLIPIPSYIDYHNIFARNGFPIRHLHLQEQDGFALAPDTLHTTLHGGEVLLFGNPANPTGTMLTDGTIIELAQTFPDTLFIVDEAFHEFTADFQTVGGRLPNIITLNSLTKFFAVPGLRLGFGILPEPYAEMVRRELPQWSVNTLAQRITVKALADDQYCRHSRSECRRLRGVLQQRLQALPGLKVFASAANYLLLKGSDGHDAEALHEKLLDRNIMIRRCGNYRGLDRFFFRVAVRGDEENQRLVDALQDVLASGRKRSRQVVKKTRALMFQGTSSNAGKSVLAAAFCRILLQDGYRVAPFKAQNMSLNSHVTGEGGEMGRAQVVQARAARIDPDWRMNPVLLKPNSDTGSQVIINGRPVGTMNVRQYHAFKEQAWEAARRSYHELAAEYDVIVLEGAGSPGEVNLKRHDFVNMKMAREAGAPVLLVGDIDRGGVYASFAGIMDVLEEWERRLVAGFVVNKFRGDETLLAEAHRFMDEHTGRPVFGVVPYLKDLALPQEDSVALRDGCYGNRRAGPDQVEIAVIDLPHISNYTDIDALHGEPDTAVRFVARPGDLGRPQAVILPGSKNVAGDLAFLVERGLDTAVHRYVQAGGSVIGICGGYQMLGRSVRDPHRLESERAQVAGIGLLPVESELASDKILRRRHGVHLASGHTVVGYEIHHGRTTDSGHPVIRFDDGSFCGCHDGSGRVWGAYLHGIFDDDRFRRWFVDELRAAKGLPKTGLVLAPYDIDTNLEALAAAIRPCFSLEQIYRLLER